MPNDLTKLPRWAQAHIASLEAQLREASRMLREVDGGEVEAEVAWWQYASSRGTIPAHTSVVMVDENGQRFQFRLLKGGGLDLNYSGNEVSVMPRAANHFIMVGNAGVPHGE